MNLQTVTVSEPFIILVPSVVCWEFIWKQWHESKNKCWMDQVLWRCSCRSVVLAACVLRAFYLRVGHASKAILRMSLRTPAADPLGNLLGSNRHPWMALGDSSLRWPVTRTHTVTYTLLSRVPSIVPTTSNLQAVDSVGCLRWREGIVKSRTPVLGSGHWLHALKQ